MLSHDDRFAFLTLPIRHIILFLPTSNRNECNMVRCSLSKRVPLVSFQIWMHFVLCSDFVGLGLLGFTYYHPDRCEPFSVRNTQDAEKARRWPITTPVVQ